MRGLVLCLGVAIAGFAGFVGCANDVGSIPGTDGGAGGDGAIGVDGSADGSVSDGGITDGAPTDGSPTDGGTSDTGADAGCNPPNLKGPTMVAVDDFCIDTTEVTNKQYGDFVGWAGDAGAPPAPCGWDAVPYGNWDEGTVMTEPNRPATYVDWCGASLYCKWAGKRLCGKRGGGGVGSSQGDFASAQKSQWFDACSKKGTYPYGNAYSAAACNTQSASSVDVSSKPGCVGGVAGLYDMSGNVEEWIDACEANGNPADQQRCAVMGGGFRATATEARCQAYFFDNGTTRSDFWDDTGFRCCGL